MLSSHWSPLSAASMRKAGRSHEARPIVNTGCQHGMMSRTRTKQYVERRTDSQPNSDTDEDLGLPATENSLVTSLAHWARQQGNYHSPDFISDSNLPTHYPPTEHGDFQLPLQHRERSGSVQSCSSIVDGLLFEIYDRWHYPRRDSLDSDTFTECSSTSEAFFGRSDACHLVFEQRHARRYHRALLQEKGLGELQQMVSQLQHRTGQSSARLIRQLKRKDRRQAKVQKNCDIVTAILQAASLKRRVDTRIRFSLEPLPGDDAFQQWKDAMKAVARLPLGIPPEFRRKVWVALADHYLCTLKIDWEKTKRFAFNEKSNPDDNKLGLQIVKDLHRTGCSGFSGQDNDEDRAVLKRVLLAYARWNKQVGYCQGFNVLAALVLEVMERKEDDALKVMIFLIDNVLPESYFANNLRALSVDMAVFRDLLRLQLPHLSRHLDHLQAAARDHSTGANYEPPLTNVFTMQWFLTVFATCLPKNTALRVWDSVILEGSEILLRTALAIWSRLQDRILGVQSADEFYTTMGLLTQEMLDDQITDADQLIKMVYLLAPFPFPQLSELRQNYTYNITPFSAAMATGQKPTRKGGINIFSDEDELDEDDIVDNINCFTGFFPPQVSPSKNRPLGEAERTQSASAYDISKASPGAYAAHPELELQTRASAEMERMTLDIGMLHKQYRRLRERQKQAHIILTAASAKAKAKTRSSATVVAPIESPVAVNHLFLGRRVAINSNRRNRHVTVAPSIAPIYPLNGTTPPLQSNNKCSAEKTNLESPHCRTESVTSQSEVSSCGLDPSDSSSPLESPSTPPTRSGRVRTVSGTSLYSDMETASLHVPDEVEAGSLPTGTDCESITSDATDVASVDELGSPVSNTETKAAHSSDIFQLPHSGLEKTDIVSDSDTVHEFDASDKESSDGLENKEVLDGEEDNHPGDIPTTNLDISDNKSDNHVKQESCTLNFQNNNNNCAKSSTSQRDDKTPTLLQLSKIALEDELTEKIRRQNTGANVQEPVSHLKNSENNVEYITKLTYKGHKKGRASSADAITKEYYESKSQSTSLTDNRVPDSSTMSKTTKAFNPFPSRHVNRNRKQNGIRLGLYTADTPPPTDGRTNKLLSGGKQISRAQINACLHRQYMAEIKQQAKGFKH